MELGPLQKEWIAALRSGKYKQGRKILRSTDDKFCCLGVACEVLNLRKQAGRVDSPRMCLEDRYYYLFDGETESTIMPLLAAQELKLFDAGGASRYHSHEALTALNDRGWTFEQIADHLEQFAEFYFSEAA